MRRHYAPTSHPASQAIHETGTHPAPPISQTPKHPPPHFLLPTVINRTQAYDEGKDKEFELEMSWIRESSGNKHALVDRSIVKAAEDKAKSELEAESDED